MRRSLGLSATALLVLLTAGAAPARTSASSSLTDKGHAVTTGRNTFSADWGGANTNDERVRAQSYNTRAARVAGGSQGGDHRVGRRRASGHLPKGRHRPRRSRRNAVVSPQPRRQLVCLGELSREAGPVSADEGHQDLISYYNLAKSLQPIPLAVFTVSNANLLYPPEDSSFDQR